MKNEDGFAFIAVSVVLVVLGIILSSGLADGGAGIQSGKLLETHTKINALKVAMQKYYKINGVLPCPSNRGDDVDSATFGVSSFSGGVCVTGNGVVSSGGVFIGDLPVRTLRLPTDMMVDAWDSRLLYAVTEAHTTGAGAVDGITVTGVTGDVSYVVVSHGKSAKGGYAAINGSLKKSCGTSTLDKENCDDDGTFVTTTLNEGTLEAEFFDDLIMWETNEKYPVEEAGEDYESSSTGTPLSGSVFLYSGAAMSVDSMGGYDGANALCASDVADARMANAEEIGVETIIAEDAWVGGLGFSELAVFPNYDCRGYTDGGDASVRGLVARTTQTVDDVLCISSYKLACFNPN